MTASTGSIGSTRARQKVMTVRPKKVSVSEPASRQPWFRTATHRDEALCETGAVAIAVTPCPLRKAQPGVDRRSAPGWRVAATAGVLLLFRQPIVDHVERR